jgi:hypothetical protein
MPEMPPMMVMPVMPPMMVMPEMPPMIKPRLDPGMPDGYYTEDTIRPYILNPHIFDKTRYFEGLQYRDHGNTQNDAPVSTSNVSELRKMFDTGKRGGKRARKSRKSRKVRKSRKTRKVGKARKSRRRARR